ncbi:MAG: hypothetical protein EPO26_09565 [Chloroflexota bacterium]|nr:MAG: hypothetical protein EPO26_09565 [Chloroflexota bacterium]
MIDWPQTWSMLASLGAIAGAIGTLFYSGLVVLTLREMQTERLSAARPVITFDLREVGFPKDLNTVIRGKAECPVTLSGWVVAGNLGSGPALDAIIALRIPDLAFDTTFGPVNIAAAPCEMRWSFKANTTIPSGAKVVTGVVQAEYRDIYAQTFKSSAALEIRVSNFVAEASTGRTLFDRASKTSLAPRGEKARRESRDANRNSGATDRQ